MKNYKISVIIPVYNSEKYLKQCLDSLVNQTYKNLEVLLINDCSKDSSLDILKSYENKYSMFKVFDLPENKRQGGARNVGIKNITGDYTYFLDSDDWLDLDYFEDIIKLLNEYPSDVIIGSKYTREFANGTKTINNDKDITFFNKIKRRELNKNEKLELVLKGKGICQSVYKSSLIKDNNLLFPEKLSYEDNYFVTMLYTYVSTIDTYEKPFYHYRQNLTSTIYKNNDSQLGRIKVEELLIEDLKKRGTFDTYKDALEMIGVKRYYLNTVATFYLYFKKDFYTLTKKLKQDVYKEYPNFKKNPFYKTEISKKDKFKVNLLEISPWAYKLVYDLVCLIKPKNY